MADNDSGFEKPRVEHVPQLHESYTPEHHMSPAKYAATRFSTLKPPMHHAPNPFRLLAMLSGKQWLFFLVGFIAWVCYIAWRFPPAIKFGSSYKNTN